MNINIYYY